MFDPSHLACGAGHVHYLLPANTLGVLDQLACGALEVASCLGVVGGTDHQLKHAAVLLQAARLVAHVKGLGGQTRCRVLWVTTIRQGPQHTGLRGGGLR